MCQKHLAAAISGETQLLHNLCLLCLRDSRSVKVCTLPIGVALQLLEPLLIVQPLVAQELSATHTSYRNDHFVLLYMLIYPRVKFCTAFHEIPVIVAGW